MKFPALLIFLVTGLSGLMPAAAQTTFSIDKAIYSVGDSITATWADGPGSATDWVGIYPRGIVPDGDPGSTVWLYVNGTQTAGVALVDGSVTFNAPNLFAGEWTAFFLANDGYTQILPGVDFEVTDPNAVLGLVTPSIRRIYGIVGQAYTGTIKAYARTNQAGGVTFSKAAGSAWLTIGDDGTLGGVPGEADVGVNLFDVEVVDALGTPLAATLTIEVFKPGTVQVPRLKVLAFNVWVGATRVADGYNKGLDSIILSGADIIAVSENATRAREWAADLGWHASPTDSDNAVLSRYPLTANFAADKVAGATVQISASPMREVHFWGCHLSPNPYGPYEARDVVGTNAERVQASLAAETNSGRVSQMNVILAAMGAQFDSADTSPVLLLGDFNCPSHLDWTQSTVDAGMHFGLLVDWPVTRATEAAGLIDAYRVAHPDPVVMPGDTWTPIDLNDVQDRIDMVHYKGRALEVEECEVFTTIDVGRWPSDHAGVLTEFSVVPVDTDNDRLADAWEVLHFGDINSQDENGDPDGDSFNNFSEFAFASVPGSGTVPAVVFENGETGSSFSFRHRIGAGIDYEVECSTDLRNWRTAGEDDLILGSTVQLGAGVGRTSYQLASPTGEIKYIRVRAF